MGRYLCILFCALLAFSLTDSIAAKRGFVSGRHSYPKSGGLSGGGSNHSYPSGGGNFSSSHGYPSSGGSYRYPSSGGFHGYPSSGGLSGNSHGYPSGGSSSSSLDYPAEKGISGNTTTGNTTNVHYHYNYNPPQQIRYTPTHGGAPVTYPVYHGTPPTYVYEYKDSGSKYGTLLAGLALMNLGTAAVAGAALSHSHSNYKPQPGEVCKFGLEKENGDYEETKIDCVLITSFIYIVEQKTQQNSPTNIMTNMTATVTNTTTINMANPEPDATTIKLNPVYEMLPNGTLVPVNVTSVNATTNATANGTNETSPADNTMTSSTIVTTNTTTVVNAVDVKGKPVEVTSIKPNPVYEMLPNGTLVPVNVTSVNAITNATANGTNETSPADNTMTSSTTVTTNTTTVVNAVDVKGKPVEVTSGMKCYVIRHTPTNNMKRSVPCGLLQTYAEKFTEDNKLI